MDRTDYIVLVTGASGAGKSTLRDYAVEQLCVPTVRAITTRRTREGEQEVHISVDRATFAELNSTNELCLVKNNHGEWYGYRRSDLSTSGVKIIEVDYRTAVDNYRDLDARIIYVYRPDILHNILTIISKRNGVANRFLDLVVQTIRRLFGSRIRNIVYFENILDEAAKLSFCDLVKDVTYA